MEVAVRVRLVLVLPRELRKPVRGNVTSSQPGLVPSPFSIPSFIPLSRPIVVCIHTRTHMYSVFRKLHTTTQFDPIILNILCHSH